MWTVLFCAGLGIAAIPLKRILARDRVTEILADHNEAEHAYRAELAETMERLFPGDLPHCAHCIIRVRHGHTILNPCPAHRPWETDVCSIPRCDFEENWICGTHQAGRHIAAPELTDDDMQRLYDMLAEETS